MEVEIIHHRPRALHFTVVRRVELEHDCPHCPKGQPEAMVRCPDCGCVMVYRGIGRLVDGRHVHHFECVHSPVEVHSVSVLLTD